MASEFGYDPQAVIAALGQRIGVLEVECAVLRAALTGPAQDDAASGDGGRIS